MTEDRVAAYLAEARGRADWVRKAERSRTPDAPHTLTVARRNSARDVRPLLAAVEGVLEYADPQRRHAVNSERVCEAISRALLGEEKTDG